MRLLVPFLFVVSLAAQQAQEAPPPGQKHPEPQNLKILPKENLIPTMRAFSMSLGVECNYCHVRGDFASDEKHEKAVAREMILMARQINTHFPDGKMHVSCYTCHRGATEPAMAPPPAGQ